MSGSDPPPNRGWIATTLLLYFLLAATLCVYWPGLSGSFMLDDIPNLATLGEFPAFDPLDRALLFIESAAAGMLGRPLSLLSFLIHDTLWPTAARPFLRTNVLLHLVNGCLVFWLVYCLARTQRNWSSGTTFALPVLVTALWLLHPLNTSTVLYVIQRMTELASLFMLAGLVLYVKGRMILADRKVLAYTLMTTGILGGLGLGALSKETAATLPLYILVVEFVLLRSPNTTIPAVPSRTWSTLFVYLPALAPWVWQTAKLQQIINAYSARPFSLAERLLTEPRVLLDYLGNILVPRRAGTGLFHDDFGISISLFEPATTIVAIVVILAGLVVGIASRRSSPVLSFCVLWFLGGHLLEAGVWPLEVYFEHRNYLPMLGPLFGAAFLITRLMETRARLPAYAVATALVALTGFAAWQNTTLFGQPVLAAETWADEHPRSQRAQQHAANLWSRLGEFERARERMETVIAENPEATSPYIIRYQLACLAEESLDGIMLTDTLGKLRTGRYDTAAPEALEKLLDLRISGRCPDMKYEYVRLMTDALQDNPRVNWGRVSRSLLVVEARAIASQGDMTTAAALVGQALKHEPNVKLSIFRANLLANAGLYDQALKTLDEAAERQRQGSILLLASLQPRIEHARRNIIRRMDQSQDPL